MYTKPLKFGPPPHFERPERHPKRLSLDARSLLVLASGRWQRLLGAEDGVAHDEPAAEEQDRHADARDAEQFLCESQA